MSSVGNLRADVMAGLAYVIIYVPVVGFVLQIVLFGIEQNRFAKFHAAQAMLLSIVEYAALILYLIISVFFSAILGGTSASAQGNSALNTLLLVFGCAFWLVVLAGTVGWFWGMITAFMGKPTKLPIIGDFAERISGGPLP